MLSAIKAAKLQPRNKVLRQRIFVCAYALFEVIDRLNFISVYQSPHSCVTPSLATLGSVFATVG